MEPVRFVVYSDYLCPWCYIASVRLDRLKAEFGDRVEFEWRSYLLRPRANPDRDVQKFRRYTESWRRPAAEPDAPSFRTWQGDSRPPSHSVPAHCVAKAAAEIGPEAFEAMHHRLLPAYFGENRDISDSGVLEDLWCEVGLPPDRYARSRDPEIAQLVLRQFAEAQNLGATGVPSMRLSDNDAVVTGAQPYELYERWLTRTLERRPTAPS